MEENNVMNNQEEINENIEEVKEETVEETIDEIVEETVEPAEDAESIQIQALCQREIPVSLYGGRNRNFHSYGIHSLQPVLRRTYGGTYREALRGDADRAAFAEQPQPDSLFHGQDRAGDTGIREGSGFGSGVCDVF